jgi:hypothetical protein
MDKEVVGVLKEQRTKEREEMKKMHVVDSHNVGDKAVPRLVEQQYRTKYQPSLVNTCN